MWIKVLIVNNGFLLILYNESVAIDRWIAKDAYDLSKRVGDIEDYLESLNETPQEDIKAS
jgi:hypothetical protein